MPSLRPATRLLRWALAFALSTAAFTTWGAPAAVAACECTAESIADSLGSQQVAFIGQLVSVDVVDSLGVYTVNVTDVFRGEATSLTKVGSLVDVDQCGFGPNPPLGRWMIFASRFPDESGPLVTNRCSATRLMFADEPIPAELGEARLPSDLMVAPDIEPPPPPRIVYRGLPDWRPAVVSAGLAFAAVGVVARLLAGRRRRTVTG